MNVYAFCLVSFLVLEYKFQPFAILYQIGQSDKMFVYFVLTLTNNLFVKEYLIFRQALRLNDDKSKVNIIIDDIEKDELITKLENGRLFIYNENLNLLKEKLTEFERNIITNKNADKNSNDFSRYYSYMYTGTNSRQARIVRAELIKKYVFSELN